MDNKSKPINESSAEEVLLDNMFDFYVSKFSNESIDAVENHFIIAISSLVDRGELDKTVVMQFLSDKGIEKELTKKPVKYSSSSYGGGDPCGRSSYRSSC